MNLCVCVDLYLICIIYVKSLYSLAQNLSHTHFPLLNCSHTLFFNFITVNFIVTEYYRVEYLCLFYSEKIFIYNEKDIQKSDLISIPLKGHVNEV